VTRKSSSSLKTICDIHLYLWCLIVITVGLGQSLGSCKASVLFLFRTKYQTSRSRRERSRRHSRLLSSLKGKKAPNVQLSCLCHYSLDTA